MFKREKRRHLCVTVTVTIGAGQTLSLPFVDSNLPTERISLFSRKETILTPVSRVYLENKTAASLPPGILTVYDEDDGYVGDAQMTGLPLGESRMVSFATDKKVEITTESKPEESVSQIKIVDGTVHAVRISRLNTTYMVKGAADADRIVIIEHPRMAGWEVTSEALQGSTPTHHRLRAKVGAG